MATFFELAVAGVVHPNDIDEHVEKWHKGEGRNQELWEYLGLTKEEYWRWVRNPNTLEMLIDQSGGSGNGTT